MTLARHAAAPLADRLRAILEPIGMFDAKDRELEPARALAARLIGGENVSVAGLRRVYERQGTGVFVSRTDQDVVGVLALIFLNAVGHAAVLAERLDPLAPDLSLVVSGREEPTAVYAWGIAASTREAAQVLVRGAIALGDAVPGIPFYVRAATEAGRRLLTEKMSFTPFPGSTAGLLWSGPRTAAQGVAA
jgi:hypothetical protein